MYRGHKVELQVLFTELRLPPSGDPSVPAVTKTLGPARRAPSTRGRNKAQYSTSKDVLEKLKKLHSLPGPKVFPFCDHSNSDFKLISMPQNKKQCREALWVRCPVSSRGKFHVTLVTWGIQVQPTSEGSAALSHRLVHCPKGHRIINRLHQC